MVDYKVTCPNDVCHNRFTVSALVAQEWVVDELGDFQSEIKNKAWVTHNPDKESHYTCVECGETGEVIHGPFLENVLEEIRDWGEEKRSLYLQALKYGNRPGT